MSGDGRIELVMGPMFSNKTSSMVKRVRYASYEGKSAVLVKYSKDTRYETGAVIAAHSELRQSSAPAGLRQAPIRVVAVEKLADVALADDELVVGVDEGHFYPDLVAQCELWANGGRRVVVAALDGSYKREGFGSIPELIPRCESVKKKNGICMQCQKRPSSFTKRTVVSEELHLIGGRESYVSVCRECHAA